MWQAPAQDEQHATQSPHRPCQDSAHLRLPSDGRSSLWYLLLTFSFRTYVPFAVSSAQQNVHFCLHSCCTGSTGASDL